jgi:predicted DNA-binding protein
MNDLNRGKVAMAKKISITIPDEMHARVQELKEEMTGKKGKRKISKICQKAISKALIEAEASRAYRLEGIKDGKHTASSFSAADKKYISRVLSNIGPYKKWSRFEKIEELKTHFEAIKKLDVDLLYPKLNEIMDGVNTPLHEWVEVADESIATDRRSEMAWSYVEGCYEGVRKEYIKKEKEENS